MASDCPITLNLQIDCEKGFDVYCVSVDRPDKGRVKKTGDEASSHIPDCETIISFNK